MHDLQIHGACDRLPLLRFQTCSKEVHDPTFLSAAPCVCFRLAKNSGRQMRLECNGNNKQHPIRYDLGLT